MEARKPAKWATAQRCQLPSLQPSCPLGWLSFLCPYSQGQAPVASGSGLTSSQAVSWTIALQMCCLLHERGRMEAKLGSFLHMGIRSLRHPKHPFFLGHDRVISSGLRDTQSPSIIGKLL